MSRGARRLLIAVGLAVAVFGVFGRAAGYGFIELDDHGYVVDNAMVQRGVSAEGIAWAFTTFRQANWHPLTWISLMVDASIGGGGASAFHVGSIVDHAAATVLLFLLLERLTGCAGRSAAVALLFAIHPLRVESVVWIAERKDVLSQALGFAALYAWVFWIEKPTKARYAAALGFFAAGLLAKPMLVTLPVLMLLLDRWPLERFDLARGLREKLPFFALSLASSVVTLLAQSRGGAVSGLTIFPASTRLANACVTVVDYLVMTVWPHALATPYPYDLARLAPARALACALVIGVVTALAVRAWRAHPHWSVGWGWYLVALTPVIGVVQVGSQPMADRYTYLPLVGPVLALVWELGARLSRPVSVALATVVVAVLAFATTAQAAYWRDSTTLFTHTIAVTGPNAVAHHALGSSLYREGRLDEAIAELRSAVAASDRYSDAWTVLGEALLKAGRNGEALDAYRHAVEDGARDPAVRAKLTAALSAEGARLLRAGDVGGAEGVLREALNGSPENAAAHATLGVVLARSGRLEEAEREFEEAVRRDPSNAGFAGNLERVRKLRRGP
jgi:Flp pilus assembly protein TadD